jgi:hypothetical protein
MPDNERADVMEPRSAAIREYLHELKSAATHRDFTFFHRPWPAAMGIFMGQYICRRPA